MGAVMAAVCFGTLLGRLYLLQWRDHDFYAARARGQQLRDTAVPAPRGDILDRNGVVLATSVTCWTIRGVPREMAEEDVAPASRRLAEILGLEEEAVYKKLSERSSNDCLLRRQVDKETADAVQAAILEEGWEGIRILQDTKRVYPEGDFAASILGFVNVDGDGVAGLELEYNSRLKGEDGVLLTAKNAWGYDLPQNYNTLARPTAGRSLRLTLDANIQHYLENALAFAAQQHHVAARAVGIVLDAKTGGILAMATKPDYDPNQPRVIYDQEARAAVEAIENQEEQAAARGLAQQAQWRNKAVSDLYEPGSVFKLITAAAALDSGAVTPGSHFSCGASYSVAGTHFHCANNKRHGGQDLSQALQNSCNQAFIQIGARMGKENFWAYFQALGLDKATGVDLPAEPAKSEHYTADRMGPAGPFVQKKKGRFAVKGQILPFLCIIMGKTQKGGGSMKEKTELTICFDPEGEPLEAVLLRLAAHVERPRE